MVPLRAGAGRAQLQGMDAEMRGPAQSVDLQDNKVLGGRMGVWRRMERLPLEVWKLHRFGVSTPKFL